MIEHFPVLSAILALYSILLPSLSESQVVDSTRGPEFEVLAQSGCGDLDLLSVTHERIFQKTESGSREYVEAIRALWGDPRGEGQVVTLWEEEETYPLILHYLPRRRAFVECDPHAGLAYVLLLSQTGPDAYGRMIRVELPADEAGAITPRRGRAGEEGGEWENPERAEFSFSVLLGGRDLRFSTKKMGAHVLLWVESTSPRYWNGRVFLLDFEKGEAAEVRLVKGRARAGRAPGPMSRFISEYTNATRPWDGTPHDELPYFAGSERDGPAIEPTAEWFRCSDLTECTAGLDPCGRWVGVGRQYWSAYDHWADSEPGEDCKTGSSLLSPEYKVNLACISGKCEIQVENDDPEGLCVP